MKSALNLSTKSFAQIKIKTLKYYEAFVFYVKQL